MRVGGQRHAPAALAPVPIVYETGCASKPVPTVAENFAPTGIRPARSESLYRLRYPGSARRTVLGSNPSRSKKFFPPPKRPDRLRDPPQPIRTGVPSPGGKNSQSVMLTTHLQPAPQLRMGGAILLLSLHAFKERTRKSNSPPQTRHYFSLLTFQIKSETGSNFLFRRWHYTISALT